MSTRRARTGAAAAAALFVTTQAGVVAGASGAAAAPGGPPGLVYAHGAFATKLHGNAVVSSGATAHSTMCADRLGVRRGNNVAKVSVPGLLTVNGLATHGRSLRVDGRPGVRSVSTATGGSLAGGAVRFGALRSVSTVTKTPKGFRTSVKHSLGSLTVAGKRRSVDLSKPRTLGVPGVGTLEIGTRARGKGALFGRARAVTLRLTLLDGTTLRVGSSRAAVFSRVPTAFRGAAWGSQAKVGDTVSTGRSAFLPVPCHGTRGEVRTNSLASVSLGSLGTAEGVTQTARTLRTATGPRGWTQSKVDDVALLGGTLRLENVTARALVREQNGTIHRSTEGTGIGRVTYLGIPLSLPTPGHPVTVPGVARISVGDVNELPRGVVSTGVVVTLLSGSDAESTVQVARAGIRMP